MTRLALIRHGHTSWNRAGRIQGRTDIPLDDEARSQLARLRLPTPWNKAALVSSPLSRAVETAELISGRTPVTYAGLIEMDWGKWEGQKGLELLANPENGYRHIEDWGWAYRPPGGESPADLQARLAPWVAALTCDTVAVCHIGIMRVLLAQAYGWDFTGPPPFQIKRNRLYILSVSPDGLAVDSEPVRLEERLP